MKAIWTKYLPCGNVRGSRIKASAEGSSRTIDYDHDCSMEEAHARAALALCSKMGWPGDLIQGARPDAMGYVFVFAADRRVENPTPSYEAQEAARHAKAGAS